jgi:hypothetical protein
VIIPLRPLNVFSLQIVGFVLRRILLLRHMRPRQLSTQLRLNPSSRAISFDVQGLPSFSRFVILTRVAAAIPNYEHRLTYAAQRFKR